MASQKNWCLTPINLICVVDAAQTEAVLFGPHGLTRMLQPGHAGAGA